MRLGHCNSLALQTLSKRMLVRNLPELEEFKEVCEGCQRGKLNRLPFPKHAAWRAKDKLELVHTDICGPMKTESLEGSRYFLLFIDDYTRMTFVYFLKEKAAAYDVFLSFKRKVEGETDRKIKCLRSDNGKEYTSNNFSKFLSDQGVRHQLTAVYTPQQNGVCERKNRTIMEMARTLLYTKHLPLRFWAEAVNTAIYLQNRLPTKALDKSTPYEMWKGIKPTVRHLRVFGCLCYHHIPKQRRTKLDAKAGKAILIGYSSQAKAYRLYSLDTLRVVISRDVIFDELNSWDWKEDKAEGNSGSQLEYSVNQGQPPSALVELPSEEPAEPASSHNPSTSPRNNALLYTTPSTHNSADPATDQESAPRRLRNITSVYRRFPRLEDCNHVETDPRTFEEAEPEPHWKAAMQEEISMIKKNDTWELCSLPSNRKPIGVKWIFKTKLNLDGSINKHKARLVAKGFLQKSEIDYGETFAPVSRMDTVRTILAMAATKGWIVWQLDVKSAFLNGKLKEEIFIEQPEGFVEPGEEHKVLRLHKALYGLKQAPRAWYDKLDDYFKSNNFSRSLSEHTLYTKKDVSNNIAIISVYVDDLIVTGGATKLITEIKANLMSTFEMTDLGKLHHFLGLEVHQLASGIFVNQEQYAKDILIKFGMSNCKEVTTPMLAGAKLSSSNDSGAADSREYRSLIGSLLYLAATRPDITHAVCLLSRFMQHPTQEHLVSVKRVLRYVKGTTDHGLWYCKEMEARVAGYSDSDWGGSPDDSRSTSGYVFLIGTGAICWGSHKQATVAQSTAEAEYIACCEAVNQAIWLKRIMMDLGEPSQGPAVIYCDNKSAIAIANNPVHHKRTKHIMIKFHFVREMQAAREINLQFCAGEDQLADLFTKALPVARFATLTKKIGVCGSSIKEEKC